MTITLICYFILYLKSNFVLGNMSGLFGDNDGNSTNDFRTKEDLIVDGNASTSSVHHEFGSTCNTYNFPT